MNLIFGLLLGTCVWYDHREGRIPNGLCAAGLVSGICFCGICCGWKELFYRSALAAGVLFGFFLLWLLRVLGGGDVKLFVWIVYYLGEKTAAFLFFTFFFSGIYGLFLLIKKRRLRYRILMFFSHVRNCMKEGKILPYPAEAIQPKEGGIVMSYGALAAYALLLMTAG